MFLELQRGFAALGISIDEALREWKHAGSDRKPTYYHQLFPGKELPAHVSECICGHAIMEQCWIYRLDRVLTLGNCCIKNYFPKGFRVKSCEICGATHRNRKDNICKRCRWARYAQLVAKQEAEEAKWVAAEEAKWDAARLAFAEAAERGAAEAAERAAAEEAKRAAEEAKRLPAKALRALMIAREQQDAFELDLALKRAGVRTSSGV